MDGLNPGHRSLSLSGSAGNKIRFKPIISFKIYSKNKIYKCPLMSFMPLVNFRDPITVKAHHA